MAFYQLSVEADQELDEILQYSFEQFGMDQMVKYNNQLVDCFEEITKPIGLYKTIKIEDEAIRSLHCQKHYIIALEDEELIFIMAIFHEKMDIMSRIKKRLKRD